MLWTSWTGWTGWTAATLEIVLPELVHIVHNVHPMADSGLPSPPVRIDSQRFLRVPRIGLSGLTRVYSSTAQPLFG
jgi:hypothetical protein